MAKEQFWLIMFNLWLAVFIASIGNKFLSFVAVAFVGYQTWEKTDIKYIFDPSGKPPETEPNSEEG